MLGVRWYESFPTSHWRGSTYTLCEKEEKQWQPAESVSGIAMLDHYCQSRDSCKVRNACPHHSDPWCRQNMCSDKNEWTSRFIHNSKHSNNIYTLSSLRRGSPNYD